MPRATQELAQAGSEIGNAARKAVRAFPDAFRGEQARAAAAASHAQADAKAAIGKLAAQAKAETARKTAAKTIAKAEAKAAKAGVRTITKAPGFFATIGNGIGKIMGASTKGAVWVIAQPIALGAKGVGFVARKTGNFFHKAPRTAWSITAVLAVAGVGSAVARRNERRTQEDMMTKAGAIEAQMAANTAGQVNPAQAQATTYMNSVGPQESALLAERQANKPGGAVISPAAIEASRTSADQATATPAV